MKSFILKANKIETNLNALTLEKGLLPLKKEKFGPVLTFGVLLILWQGLSQFYSPLILPSPVATLATLVGIIREKDFFAAIMVTMQRLLFGLLWAVAAGSVLGIIMGNCRRLKSLLESFIYTIQAIPPILLMTLAMIWFGLDGRATIFIVFIACLPIMAVNIKEGFENIDRKLIEMGELFSFSKWEMLTEIILPSLKAYFKSGLIVVMGLGWKLAVMGEVLGSGSGLGSQIADARINLETNKVFAWGIVVIALCYLSQQLIASFFNKRGWQS
ncbi:MAG: ABC transporter permease [Bacillota bacterium]|jgi:NitT/TauT family transport system permease protein